MNFRSTFMPNLLTFILSEWLFETVEVSTTLLFSVFLRHSTVFWFSFQKEYWWILNWLITMSSCMNNNLKISLFTKTGATTIKINVRYPTYVQIIYRFRKRCINIMPFATDPSECYLFTNNPGVLNRTHRTC